MKKKYSKGEIEEVEIIKDFLPSPQNLVLKNNEIKVTISLTKDSLDFFKTQASKYHTSHQIMIKSLLDKYANYHKNH